MRIWGIKSHFTTSYHPESNGLVERFHRRLKESLIALGSEEPNDWFWRLPCSLLAIRTTLKPDLGSSPADLVYGEGLSVPGTLIQTQPLTEDEETQAYPNFLNNLRLEVARLQPTATSAHRRPRVHVPDELSRASHVLVRRGGVQPSFCAPFTGPHKVISREENSYRIAMPGGRPENISISRLKPAMMPTDEDNLDLTPPPPPSPPRPGRRPRPPRNPPPPSNRRTRSNTQNNEEPPDDDLDNRLNRLRSIPEASDNEPNDVQTEPSTNPPPRSPPQQRNPRSRERRRTTSPFSSEGSSSNNSRERSPPPIALEVPPAPIGSPVPDPNDGHVPPDENLAACPCDPPAGPCKGRYFTPRRKRLFSKSGGPVPPFPEDNTAQRSRSRSPNIGQRPRPPLSFSKPKPGNFSYQRRRPDVNALREILLSLNPMN